MNKDVYLVVKKVDSTAEMKDGKLDVEKVEHWVDHWAVKMADMKAAKLDETTGVILVELKDLIVVGKTAARMDQKLVAEMVGYWVDKLDLNMVEMSVF